MPRFALTEDSSCCSSAAGAGAARMQAKLAMSSSSCAVSKQFSLVFNDEKREKMTDY